MTTLLPAHLARYAEVLTDFDAFADALRRPLPQTLAVNPLRTSAPELAELLADSYSLTPVGWRTDAFRLHPENRPGRDWAFSAGLFTLQEEASLLPTWMLNARPGHRVLDLCAAPGNKTTHLALDMGNRGTLIANELKPQRLTPLHDVCRRLGLTNVSSSAHDGRSYPAAAAQFDRILVDAPCSSEGKARRGYLKAASSNFRAFITAQQRDLLKRAVQLCRPGGRLVYSTCTFAPEENEAVVSDILDWADGELRVVPVAAELPGRSGGLTEFSGQHFHPSLADAVRLWPHRADTGGFFAVLLERSGSPATGRIDCQPLPPAASATLIAEALDRYAIPHRALEGLHAFATRSHLRLVAADHTPPEGVTLQAIGLECAGLRDGRARLATAGAMALGPLAQRQRIVLDASQRDRWRARLSQTLTAEAVEACQPGPVLVEFAGHVLGSGLLRQTEHGARLLESHCPKAWSRPLDR